MLGSIYAYCPNICPVLKRNQNATFGAHRLVRKDFPPLGFEPRTQKDQPVVMLG